MEEKKNWFARHKVITGFLIFFAFIFIITVFSGSKTEKSSNVNTEQIQPVKQAVQESQQTTQAKITVEDVGQVYSGSVNRPNIMVENTGTREIDISIDVILLRDSQQITKENNVIFMAGSNFIQKIESGDALRGQLNWLYQDLTQGKTYTLKVELRDGASARVIASDSKEFRA